MRHALNNSTTPMIGLNTSGGSLIRPPRYAIGIDVAANGQNSLQEK